MNRYMNLENDRIGLRIPLEKKKLIYELCKLRGEDLSDFVRRAINKELASLGYLSDLECKALGV